MLLQVIRLATLLVGLVWGTQVFAAWQDEPAKAAPKEESANRQEDESDEKTGDEKETEKEPTAVDLMRKAMVLAREENLDGAIELIEKAAAMDPKDVRIALTLIGATQARAQELVNDDKRKDANPYFYKAAALVRALSDDAARMIGDNAGSVIYNEACSFAVDGQKDKALASLDEAFERGYVDIDQTRADVDFESIRESAEFVALLEKHARLIHEKMVAETKGELESFQPYDFDFKLKNLDGEDVHLADYKGKVLIVDFWGTWCPPCRAEIPHFIKLKDSYGDKGLEVIGLAYEQVDDDEEATKGVKEFSEANKLNYACAIGDEETQNMIPDFQGYPTTLFIDREGVVRLQLVGLQPHDKLELVVQHLLDAERE